MNMPSELKQAVSRGLPVELTDGTERYLVIRSEMYERLMATLDLSEPDESQRKAQLQAMGRAAGWEDPAMDGCNDLDPR
jgi:hypothetical protein